MGWELYVFILLIFSAQGAPAGPLALNFAALAKRRKPEHEFAKISNLQVGPIATSGLPATPRSRPPRGRRGDV